MELWIHTSLETERKKNDEKADKRRPLLLLLLINSGGSLTCFFMDQWCVCYDECKVLRKARGNDLMLQIWWDEPLKHNHSVTIMHLVLWSCSLPFMLCFFFFLGFTELEFAQNVTGTMQGLNRSKDFGSYRITFVILHVSYFIFTV